MRYVDVGKCLGALEQAVDFATAGQSLEPGGVVDKAVRRVVAEIKSPTGPVIQDAANDGLPENSTPSKE